MMAADVKVTGCKGAPKCSLNADDCVSLDDILQSFNAPISEEHAWALCYQCAKCFKNAFDREDGENKHNKRFLVPQLNHVMLHKDGQVHPSTIYDDSGGTFGTGSSRTKTTSTTTIVSDLGVVIYQALDFGLREEEERNLSPELERLIEMMTASSDLGDEEESHEKQQETDDEGIERDSGESSEDDHSGAAAVVESTSTNGVVNGTAGSSGSKGKSTEVTLDRVIEACVAHVPSPSQAEAHYRAVCRALVAEALELASFLETISKGTKALRSSSVSYNGNHSLVDMTDSLTATPLGGRHSGAASSSSGASSPDHLDSLCFSDWARLWMQVMQQLRHGVQLKKVAAAGESRGIVAEYELTPYEILMDDIRSRRYKLNKVMVDGDIPHRVKKDAHAIILDFIRSRPPLRKASERRLPPPPKRARSPRELLMESIKGGAPLRHTSSPHKSVSVDQSLTYSTKEADVSDTSNSSTRRLIKVDFSMLKEDYDEDDDDDDEDENAIIREVLDSPGLDVDFSDFSGFGREGQFEGEKEKGGRIAGKGRTATAPWRRTAYDLATQCPTRRSLMLNRRHSILGCERDSLNQSQLRPNSASSAANSTMSTSSSSSAASAASALSFDSEANLSSLPAELTCSRISLQEEFLQSGSVSRCRFAESEWEQENRKHCQQAMECLTLTLEEIVHIRSVLTKAELESLPVEGHVKEDVEKRKVCFLCLKTRFSIFGPWGQKCKMCKRTVCAKCYSKMRIPTEHFSRVPVFALSPNLSPEEEEDEDEDEVSGKAGPSSSVTSFPRNFVSRLLVSELPQGLLLRNSVGSAPSSPNLPRSPISGSPQHQQSSNASNKTLPSNTTAPLSTSSSLADHDTGERKCGDGAESAPHQLSSITQNGSAPKSLPAPMMSTPNPRRGRLTRSKTLGRPVGGPQAEKLKGLQMNVCHDCKTMVLHIIKTSRTKRNNAIKNLSLDLSPVY